MTRRAARSDANQPEIVDALKKIGARVQHLHGVGQGCPDLLCGHGGNLTLIEVKTPSGKLTERQERWHEEWAGYVHVVTSAEEAVNLILGRTQGVIG